jgi:hypothetical protein
LLPPKTKITSRNGRCLLTPGFSPCLIGTIVGYFWADQVLTHLELFSWTSSSPSFTSKQQTAIEHETNKLDLGMNAGKLGIQPK